MSKRVYYLLLIVLVLAVFVLIFGNKEIFLFINRQMANPLLDFVVLKILIPIFFLLPGVPFLMLFFNKSPHLCAGDYKRCGDKYRKLGFVSLISGPLFYILGSKILKVIFAHPRPAEILDARIIGPWHSSSLSFPSTTTMLAFGFALPIFLRNKKIGIPLLVLASLVGLSVIYTGWHFPGDVLAGIFFATVFALIIDKIIYNDSARRE